MRDVLHKNPLWIVFFTIFLDVIGIGVLIPIIPKLLGDPSADSYLLKGVTSLGTGYILLGFLVAVYPLCMFFSAPILGQLSDKIGRKKILGFSIFGTCIGYVLFAIAIITKNIPLLFASRALDGITGGNISVAQAAIADLSTPETRMKNFGMIGACFGVGFILGPWLGGILASPSVVSWFSASTPFWFTSILSFINFILIFTLYPHTREIVDQKLHIDWEKSIHNIVKAFTLPKLKTIFITLFIQQFGFGFYMAFASVYFVSKFGVTEAQIGNYFGLVGLGITLAQVVVVRRLAKKYPEEKVMKVGLVLTALELLILLALSSWWMVMIYGVVFALTLGPVFANSGALVSKSADHDTQGQVLGIQASVQSLAQSIPPMLAGFLAAHFSPRVPIVAAAVLVIISAIYFVKNYHHVSTVTAR